MEDIEIWKDIIGYEGLYQVSSFGNVKSLARQKLHGRYYVNFSEKLFKLKIGSRGYYKVTLSKNNTKKYYNVATLVAIMFLNHIQCGHELVIDHIDNDRLNNHVNNLRIVSTRLNNSNLKNKINMSSKYTGVTWHKINKNWIASIKINKIKKHLGSFQTELEASEAYQKALANLQRQ